MNQITIITVIFIVIKIMMMEGILYVTDENNKKRFVQIDLEKYGEIWEDFYDGLLAEMSKGEESISLEQLGEELKAEGLLDEI